eukprot:ctg_3190.g700
MALACGLGCCLARIVACISYGSPQCAALVPAYLSRNRRRTLLSVLSCPAFPFSAPRYRTLFHPSLLSWYCPAPHRYDCTDASCTATLDHTLRQGARRRRRIHLCAGARRRSRLRAGQRRRRVDRRAAAAGAARIRAAAAAAHV